MVHDHTSSTDRMPEFESDEHAEWRIHDGGVMVLRFDRKNGEWTGEWERLDPEAPDYREPRTISPEEAQTIARARDLRLRDGTKPG